MRFNDTIIINMAKPDLYFKYLKITVSKTSTNISATTRDSKTPWERQKYVRNIYLETENN